MAAPDGLLVVDKPADWTSHDVVARTRRLCATRKVGHAGTLDPMATGVLVLGIGRATRLLTFLVGCDKAYAATIRLGQSTLTDDAEGEVTGSADPGAVSALDAAALSAAVGRLTGAIEQVPSAVSAIKVKGERAYHRVRAGEDVVLPSRPVTVSRFTVLGTRAATATGTGTGAATGTATADLAGRTATDALAGRPDLPVLDVDVEVVVSSGTYVRALARDLGADLGVGGHLTALRRTRVGAFTLERAHPLAELEALGDPERMPVIALADAARAGFAARELDEPSARAIGYGQRVESAHPGRVEPVAAFGPDGRLVAMLDESGPLAKAFVVFAPQGS